MPLFLFDINGVLVAGSFFLNFVSFAAEHDVALTMKDAFAVSKQLDVIAEQRCPGCELQVCRAEDVAFGSHMRTLLYRGDMTYEEVRRGLLTALERSQDKLENEATLRLFIEFMTNPCAMTKYDTAIGLAERLIPHLSMRYGAESLYILSNASRGIYDEYKKNFPLIFNHFFDANVSLSEETGRCKPFKEAYEHFCISKSIDPADVIFFDDKQVNIDAARSVGMNAYLFSEDMGDEGGAVLAEHGFLPKAPEKSVDAQKGRV